MKKSRKKKPAEPTFRLVFRGEVLPAFEAGLVRGALVQALKLDERRAAKLFSGRRTVVRRAVDEETALRYVARFAELGARLRAEPEPPPTWRPELQQEFLLDQDSPGPVRWLALNAAGLVALGVVVLSAGGLFWAAVAYTDAAQRVAGVRLDMPGQATPGTQPQPPGASRDGPLAPGVQAATEESAGDADVLASLQPAALREYRLGYAAAKGHKAFATSESGAYGWMGGANTSDEAREAALSRCAAAMSSSESSCSILDADGILER